jgi:phosphate transport system substrate-binding protein
MRNFLLGLTGAIALSFNLQAAEMTGAGASFVFPAMSKWSSAYNQATQNKVNYQSIGSGGGIAQIKAKTVDFGSSDKPLDSAELTTAGLVQFPSVTGAVVPVINVPGINPGQLKLNGQVLGDIYLGKITKWNDPAIAALNAGTTLPAMSIRPIKRADGSGTTYNFTSFLSKTNGEWKAKVGEGIAVRWPNPSTVGGKGNEGVAAYTRQIKGAIGYVELSYVKLNKMSYVQMQNAAGKFVSPNADSIKAAAVSADWKNSKDFNLMITNAPGEGAWPIAATNFVLMAKAPRDAARAKASLEFFKWVYANGDQAALDLGYVPLPDDLVAQIDAYWSANVKY